MRRAALLVSLIPLSLQAYEQDWTDKRIESPSLFKMDGTVFSGFEATDSSVIGIPDQSGPTSTATGFQITRAYLDFRSEVKDGPYKKVNFRITPDAARVASQGDGCKKAGSGGNTAVCEQKNDHVFFLKYAYIDIPVLSGLSVRMGQQHIPIVDGQAGTSFTRYWDHRYLDRASVEELGMASSTDLGLAIIYKHSHFGIHGLLGNGEGFSHSNAERNPKAYDAIGDLARGTGDSYGQDFYGLFTVKPTGDAKDFEVALGLPVRFQNVMGMHESEYRYVSADLDPNNDGNLDNRISYTYLRGNPRAKQDYYYGAEVDLAVRQESFEISAGAGTVVRRDQRSTATRLTDKIVKDPIDTTKYDQVFGTIRIEEDAMGQANYIFGSIKVGSFGAVARYTEGDGGTFDGRLGVQPGKARLKTMVLKDLENNQLGDIKYSDLRTLDLGRARFRKVMYGLNYHFSPQFRLTLGVIEVRATDAATGYPTKINWLQAIPVEGTTAAGAKKTGTVSDQIESSKITSALGTPAGEKFILNDIFGKERIDRQVFLRTEMTF
ncbi:MAG: hypothetical protein HS115_02345 [Spirochaetales bacterium]|nr:hypothetical protein [Spirochaetales bacterium]